MPRESIWSSPHAAAVGRRYNTGLIKSNIPSRIAFKVASQVLSERFWITRSEILEEAICSFYPVGSSDSVPQGGFISDEEIENVVKYLQTTYGAADIHQVRRGSRNGEKPPRKGKRGGAQNASGGSDTEVDELFLEAVRIAIDVKQISASYLQRKLGLGYSRASRIIDQMEERATSARRDDNLVRHVLISSLPELPDE